MSSYVPVVSFSRSESSVDDLPDEVLEYILSLVAPYKDLQECALVCKRWHRSVNSVIRHTQKSLTRAISDFNIRWENITPSEMAPTITKRYSHSACRYENSMYVFGGCTSTSTTFNDLWRLDLNKRQWVRPLTMGTYPSPKACASIVCYRDALILFGGWTHPSPYPLHQVWRLFNELHVYTISSNRWTCINTSITPPAMAGHSATIQKELMVVFGGLQKNNVMTGHYGITNDVWCFNLENQTWIKQSTTDSKPHARYGQTQINLDDKNILILGGCGGPNLVFSDVWLLSLTDPIWTWHEVKIKNPQSAAPHMWCHPACKVGQHVVIFSKNPVSSAPPYRYNAQWNSPLQIRNLNVFPPRDAPQTPGDRRESENSPELRPVDKDVNINGRHGTLRKHSTSTQQSASSSMQQGANSPSSSSGEESDSEINVSPSLNKRSTEHQLSSNDQVKKSSYNNIPKPVLASSFNNSESAGPSGLNSASPSNLNFSPSNVSLSMAAFRDPVQTLKSNAMRNRMRQLESLKRMEERYLKNFVKKNNNSADNNSNNSNNNDGDDVEDDGEVNARISRKNRSTNRNDINVQTSPTLKINPPKNIMSMFVLDISHVLTDDCYVEWLPLRLDSNYNGGPEERILYTLVLGKGELIMFGGIQKDAMSITTQAQMPSNVSNIVSNSLHFISALKGII